MTLANLKTRTASTSSVSSTSVSGSALTHAELDSNLINLRDSSWGLASDDSTVVQVSDDKTIKIAGGTNITTALSGDTLTITGAAAPITALNNKTANRLTTIGSTTTELDGEANLTFDGSTLAATGAITATTDITATGTIGNDAVSITDNVISTSRSNDTLRLEANGTGYINLGNADITVQTSNPRSQNGVLRIYDQGSEFDFSAQDSSSERKYTHTTLTKVKSNGTDSSNSNNRWRNAYDILDIDVNGALLTGSRPDLIAASVAEMSIQNTAGSSNTGKLANCTAYFGNVYAFGNSSQLDIDNALGMEIRHFNEASSGQTINLTNAIGFQFRGVSNDGSGTNNSVNEICVDYQAGDATNKIFLQTDTDTALSNVGTLNKYRESINALTNSSTITVDCSLAPVHTCTIQQATGFNFKNLGTGQTATVIVKQDGTGGRTATFTEEDSTAIKFQGGAPTLSTGANAIDVITVFNTGSEVLGNCAKAYA
jgi:hypothetical protein